MAYEGVRAMFEAYSRNKYAVHRRGAMDVEQRLAIDHLASLRLYLRPGGGYFGAKKAMEPLDPSMDMTTIPFGWSAANIRTPRT